MLRGLLVAAVGVALGSSATAAAPAPAGTTSAGATHKLIVTVKKTLAPAAEKRLAILVLITQGDGAPAGAVVTPSRPLTVHLASGRLYRVKAELDVSCKGTCAASYRISGSADHKLEIVPSCRPNASGFVCSKVTIVKRY